MNGDHNRISRCRWRQIDGTRCVNHTTARDCRVDHCDFSELTNPTTRKQVIAREPAGFDNGTNVRNLLDYCYFHNMNETNSIGNGQEMLRTSAQTTNVSLSPAGEIVTVDHCLFFNCAISGEAEMCSIKSGGWKFSFCTFDDVNYYISFRTADNGEIRSCWFELMRNPCFNIFGANHLFIGNRLVH